MTSPPDWLPPIIQLSDAEGDWARYCDLVYGEFYKDFIRSQPRYDGKWVRCRRDPLSQGKEAGFWHCVSEGENEANRVPDTRRCERIRWARALIEHPNDPQVDHWPTTRGTDKRRVFWLAEEYVVILAERTRSRDGFMYWQLVTAYCSNFERTIERLRRERDQARNSRHRNG